MRKFSDIDLYETATYKRKITRKDIFQYAELVGDKNPLHVDEQFAKRSFFKGIICHGTFLDGIISTAFVEKIPGPGTVLLSLTTKYIKPIRENDEIEITLKVIEKNSEKKTFMISIKSSNQSGELVAIGEAKVIMLSDLENMKRD